MNAEKVTDLCSIPSQMHTRQSQVMHYRKVSQYVTTVDKPSRQIYDG